jgi:hypothetical protein
MIAEAAGHRWRRILAERHMLPGEIVPRDEQRLHSRVVTQALAVAVGQASEPAKSHANGEIEPLDMRSAYLVLIAISEHRQLFDIGYLGWRVAGGFLGAAVVLY